MGKKSSASLIIGLCFLAVLPAIMAGLASAFFLWALDEVTHFRWHHQWLVYLLPLAGLGSGLLYHYLGRSVERGTNLIMDEIHQPGGGIPKRMVSLVLIGTLVTHLFGGSAGREGTAVQMGGSISNAFGRFMKITPLQMRVLLMCGIAAGFGSVFGTPITGAVFAIEVLRMESIPYTAVIPVLVAGAMGDLACSLCGIRHTVYHLAIADGEIHRWWSVHPWVLVKVILCAPLFGFAAWLFACLAHLTQSFLKSKISYAPFRPVIGGLVVVMATLLIGNQDYLGIGVTSQREGGVSILGAFEQQNIGYLSWLWKLLLTVATVGSGFKGGEVTPLFFIGATLGNALSTIVHSPTDLFAGLGFIAVFAGATKTPLACTIMGMELFGMHYGLYFGIACFIAYFCSGKTGIYVGKQKNDTTKIFPA